MPVSAYYDVLVIEEGRAEERPTIAVSRTPTEEMTMQVYVQAEWHRRTPDGMNCACGPRIPTDMLFIRREILSEREIDGRPSGKLCVECFTAFERWRASEYDKQAREDERRQVEEWEADARRRMEESDRRITERMAKLAKPPEKDEEE